MKKALITGITGQDGSYLAELLLSKHYTVVGITSGSSSKQNLNAIEGSIELVTGDVTDEKFVQETVQRHLPDEIYNLASVATVAKPWDDIAELSRVVALAPVYFLEAIRSHRPSTRFFQASSSEMFGVAHMSPQSEIAGQHPRNPYGVSKSFAHSMVGAYRVQQGVFAVSGILYTHESPRRPEQFVTRKITLSLAKIKLGLLDAFELGNLESNRDWGSAADYVEAMWRMLRAPVPDDYVIATGITHTVREFVLAAASALDMKITFEGAGLDEIAHDASGRVIIRVNPAFYRPTEAVPLCGDISKIEQQLGWKPSTTFEALVSEMTSYDLELAGNFQK